MIPYEVEKVAVWPQGNEIQSSDEEEPSIILFYPANDSVTPLPPIPSALKISTLAIQLATLPIVRLFSQDSPYEITAFQDSSADIRDALAANKSITGIMESISQSMTDNIRVGPNTTNVYGTAYFVEIYVIIRWPWLLLPGLLVLLSAMFLLLTMRMSRKGRGSPLWKSRVLPFLFHGLDGWEKGELRVSDEAGMDQAGKKMKAQLLKNGEGDRKFVRA